MNVISVETDRDGVAWVVFNNWRQKYNLLNPPELRQLETIISGLTRKPPRGVVFISAKKDMFLGGLDPAELPKLSDPKTAEEFSLAGQRLFDQVAALPVPTVAAIDGRCTCGGLEFALACRYRVATDSPHTVLSLTDVRVGAVPGWGATYRLPKLIGVWQALQMIILAGAILPSAARRMGLVDAVVKASELRGLARSLATGESQLKQREASAWKRVWPIRALACRMARWIAQVNPGSSDTVAQPSYLRLLPLVVQQTGNLPVRTQLAAINAVETVLATRKTEDRQRLTARLFAEAVTSEECKNLPRMLHLRSADRYSKLLGFGPLRPTPDSPKGNAGSGRDRRRSRGCPSRAMVQSPRHHRAALLTQTGRAAGLDATDRGAVYGAAQTTKIVRNRTAGWLGSVAFD